MACGNCHTPISEVGLDTSRALAGQLAEQSNKFTAIASNFTPASQVADWSDEELARAIREGIRPDGTVIGLPMPIELYRGLSDDDVMSVVLYLRQLPSEESDPGESFSTIPLPAAYGRPMTSNPGVPPGVTVA